MKFYMGACRSLPLFIYDCGQVIRGCIEGANQDWRVFGLGLLSVWCRRYKTRRHLYSLAPEQLLDIGLTIEQRDKEMHKYFWQS